MKNSHAPKSRTKPCCICRKWFIPCPRLGDRQKTCGHEACKAERKRRVQAEWARKNADYWTERRLREQAARLESGDSKPANKPPPSGLQKLPVSYIKDEIGAPALAILTFLARLLDRTAQVSIRRQAIDLERKLNRDLHRTPQVSIRTEAGDAMAELNGVQECGAQVAIADSGG